MLGCTDTPFLASCRCRTRVGHRNGYDSLDSGVRRVSSFFFFFFFVSPTRADTAPTQLRRGSDTSDTPAVKKKKKISAYFGSFRPISAEMKISSDTRFWLKKKKSKSKSYLLLLGFVLFFLLIFFLISVSSSSSSSSSSSFGFGLLPD